MAPNVMTSGEAFEILWCDSAAGLPIGAGALFHAAEFDAFDLSMDWFRLLENRTIFPGIAARYYVLKQGDEIVGVLPLSFQNAEKWNSQVSGLTKFYSSIYRPLLSSSVSFGELAVCLKEVLSDSHAGALRFDAMDPAHHSFTALEEALSYAGLKPFRFFCFGNWYLPVEGRSFDAYFSGLSSRVRNTTIRREKKFFASGRGRLEIVSGGDRMDDAIRAWDKIYSASWKVPEPFPRFIPELIRMCAERGWLRLGIAYYDEEPVAAQLWIVSHGRAAIYKLAYDEKYSKLSPGTVLTVFLMRHAFDIDKVTELDYLIGDDDYKKDWMTHRRERWGIVAYNPMTLSGLVGIATHRLGQLRRHLLKADQGAKTERGMISQFLSSTILKISSSLNAGKSLLRCGTQVNQS